MSPEPLWWERRRVSLFCILASMRARLMFVPLVLLLAFAAPTRADVFTAPFVNSPYTVPAGAVGVHVVVIGGAGGVSAGGVLGGRGAVVIADVPLTAGTTIYARVGIHGSDNPADLPAASNGAGATFGAGSAGSGGGASDIRTCSNDCAPSASTRLVVAGGGGGGGGGPAGGVGGDAGQPGAHGGHSVTGGGAGTAAAGGAAGAGGDVAATAGSAGQGGTGADGNGGASTGGGGGGGWFGGGGGGGDTSADSTRGGGGGGGGSSFTTTSATGVTAATTTDAPSVTITPIFPAKPQCASATAQTMKGTPVTITLRCTTPSSAPITYQVATPPAHGTLSAIGSNATITYTPAAGYTGPDIFAYRATNTGGTADPAIVSLTVTAPPAPPPPRLTAPPSLSRSSLASGARVRLTNLKPGSRATIAIRVAGKTIASVRKTAGNDGTLSVKIKLTSKQRKRIGRRRSITLRCSVVGAGGRASVLTKTLTLRH